jgi:hypothetical protein
MPFGATLHFLPTTDAPCLQGFWLCRLGLSARQPVGQKDHVLASGEIVGTFRNPQTN